MAEPQRKFSKTSTATLQRNNTSLSKHTSCHFCIIQDTRDLLALPQLKELRLGRINALVPEPDTTLTFQGLIRLGIGRDVNDEVVDTLIARAPKLGILAFWADKNSAWNPFCLNVSRIKIFSTIKTLLLRNNNIVSIENLAGLGLKQLKWLDLRINYITNLGPLSRMKAPFSLELNLEHNRYTSLQLLQKSYQTILTRRALTGTPGQHTFFTH